MEFTFSYTTVLGLLLCVYAFPLWHIQWLGTLFYYFILRPKLPIRLLEPDDLFAPVVRTTRCSIFAHDVNRHKSNSTYFTDADICYAESASRLASKSFNLAIKRGKPAFPRLGATGAIFLKEIKLFQKYQISSKILSWDEKWIYSAVKFETPDSEVKAGATRKTFAVLVAKTVFKEGRRTVPPQETFEESGLIPLPHVEGKDQNGTNGKISDSLGSNIGGSSAIWSRDRIEEERVKGLAVAKALFAFESLPSMDWEKYGKMTSLW